jgi:NIPSNAP
MFATMRRMNIPPARTAAADFDFDSHVQPLEDGVVELRQYTLHAGRRDALIELFEREFIEPQEALGMRVIGPFRDLDADDRFVWLRGFRDMAGRAASLAAFYGGPVWQAHRNAANATMIDSDNVLLLRPAWPGAGIDMRGRTRAAVGSRAQAAGLLDASVFHLREPASPDLLQFCRDVMSPMLERGGAQSQGWYVTEPAANNFPRLPVREGETVLAGLALFTDAEAFDTFRRSDAWTRAVQPTLAHWLSGPTESLRLAPTSRSALHASASIEGFQTRDTRSR